MHIKPPPILLFKSDRNDKSDKDYVGFKLRRDMTSEKLYLYQLKMYLFKNGNPEGFLLFIRNFSLTIKALETLETAAKVHYLCSLFCVEYLCQFDSLPSDV